MRRFIIATDNQNLKIEGANIIGMEIADLPAIFNQDCLNVLSENQYEQLLETKYMYGVEIEFENYLTGYRKFLETIKAFDSQIICLFDVSIKRYINNSELTYFASNKLLPSKLFNVEIKASEAGCEYITIGLASIGLKEFVFKSDMYLNEEDFQIFKAVVTNYIIGKLAAVYINGMKINYGINEEQDNFIFTYNRPAKIFEFYIRDDSYLNAIRYNLIKYNWPAYLQLRQTKPDLGEYIVNKAKVNDIANFEVGHVEEFTIVCEGINYNQDNLFYAYKYL